MVEEAFLSLPDAVYISGEIPEETLLHGAKVAVGKGLPVFMALSGGDAFPYEQLPQLELLSLNEEAVLAATGIRPSATDACLAAAMALSRRVQAAYYVLRLGKRGAYIYSGRQCYFYPAYSVKAVDTSGAGDAFTAALTLRYLQNGGEVAESTRFANAVSALTVCRHGAGIALPKKEEAELFFAKAPLP